MYQQLSFVFSISLFLFACSGTKNNDLLFEGFVHPPAESRPFVRWWWNGNHLDTTEIKRELDVLSLAGIGGVEINPIEMPEQANTEAVKAIEWLSKEWNSIVAFTAKEAHRRNMMADLIVGTGWPFGGEFLAVDETVQRVILHRLSYSTGETIRENEESLYDKLLNAQRYMRQRQTNNIEVLFIQLVPLDMKNISEIIDLTDEYNLNRQLNYTIPNGRYHLVYGILQKSYREVMHGATGGAGPVMDHYRKDVTLAYLNRLLKISEDTGISLQELFRALFCDSIELDGANWTENFDHIFYQSYGYRLEPYYPFVFYDRNDGYKDDVIYEQLTDEIKRVRYDFNKLMVNTFLKNFTQVFHDFCNGLGLQSRYQAYGYPFLMGLLDGYLIPDIPESNNWIYSGIDMNGDEWAWNQLHGYMVWNVYASSAGHLKGRKIISCESMTNTNGVFMTSMEEIKRHDDMNFISGMNHSVLHGYNYSPPEAGFPGWVRYGAYFSEQNTWWPYFPKWVAYNSRLSYLFQQTNPVRQIAVLAPEGDLWTEYGLNRIPFHMTPWYCNHLWESLSQVGSSCDYIGESIICDAKKTKGTLTYGPMSYQMIILCGIRSLHPQTAASLQEFAERGGKLVILDTIPDRSLSMQDIETGNDMVQKAFSGMLEQKNVFLMDAPTQASELLAWTVDMLAKTGITPDVKIEKPNKDVFQIRKSKNDQDIFFFVNTHRKQSRSFKAIFPTGSKTPWVWNPENGTREVFPYTGNPNTLDIELQPLQSLLLVFEPKLKGKPMKMDVSGKENMTQIIKGPWHVRFEHRNGDIFEKTFDQLEDFSKLDDPKLNSFAGTVTYSVLFDSDISGKGAKLELGELNRGIAEVYINEKSAGINWYGKPVFDVKDLLIKGQNELIIKYTTVLSNYCKSLKDNPTASRWTLQHHVISCGLTGDVVINQ